MSVKLAEWDQLVRLVRKEFRAQPALLAWEALRAPPESPELWGQQVRMVRLAEREAWVRLALSDPRVPQVPEAQREAWAQLVSVAQQERMAAMVQKVLQARPVRRGSLARMDQEVRRALRGRTDPPGLRVRRAARVVQDLLDRLALAQPAPQEQIRPSPGRRGQPALDRLALQEQIQP